MHQAAYLLALFALLSQLLALIRDRLFAGSFGASETLDIYYAAFRIPDLLFAMVASLLSLYALLPILSRLESSAGKTASFLRGILLIFFVGMGSIAAVVWLLAPVLVPWVAPGLDSEHVVTLTRILLLQPILLGASNIIASLTQLRHRFLLYSISPLLYNIGIIVGITALYPQMGLEGLGWGVVLGAALHLGIQLPFFFAERGADRVPAREVWRSMREVLTLSVPRTLALAAGQISLLVLIALASFLVPGSIAVFTFAFNLQAVPLAIIGVSYSVAAFPTLSRLHAAGERKQFLEHIEAALRHMLFWAIPATIFVIVLRAQLVRTILGVGAFDWDATRLTAAALALFVIGLCAQSITMLVARAYYAAGKTARPLVFAIVGVVVTMLSAVILIRAFEVSVFWRTFLESLLRVDNIAGTAVLMLALAYCLGALATAWVGLAAFSGEFGLSLKGLRRLAFESFAAAVIGGAVTYGTLWLLGGVVDINTTVGVVTEGFVAGVLGLGATIAVLALLRNQELLETYGSLRKRFVSEPPAVEATDVA